MNGAPTGTEPGDEVLAGMRQMPKGEGLPGNGRVGELVATRQIRDRGDLAQLPHPDPGPLATVLDHQRAFQNPRRRNPVVSTSN